MSSFWKQVGRISSAVSSLVNFNPPVKLAVVVQSAFRLVTSPIAVGVKIQDPFRGLYQPRIKLAFGLLDAVTALIRPKVKVATRIQSSLSYRPPIDPAFELEHLSVNLTSKFGVDSIVSLGADTWSNTQNVRGLSDGVISSVRGNALAARSYSITFGYNDRIGKESLQIDSVVVKVYITHISTLNNSTRRFFLDWAVGEGFSSQSFDTGEVSTGVEALEDPVEFDLYSMGLTTWEQLNALSGQIDIDVDALGVTAGADLDAVEIHVTASLIDPL